MGGRKTLWEKEKLLFTRNFSFSHSVCERLILHTCKNQGFVWEISSANHLLVTTQFQLLSTLEMKPFENIMGKGEKCW